MFQVRTLLGEPPLVELADPAAGSLAVVAPRRGGMLTRLRVGDFDALYLDEATFRDPAKNVRGGSPVLFPTPGKLVDDTWARDGRTGSLLQHGFARNLPWELRGMSTEGAAAVTIGLEANDETRRRFPWDFALTYTYALRGAALTIEQRIRNQGNEPMPFGAGFHPYFRVPQQEKAGATITTAATRAFDNVTKKEGPFTGFDLTRPEVDLHLVDHGSTAATLAWGGRRIEVRGSAEYTHWVVWTLAGKDFVCVEPWTCPGNALNTGERLLWVAPGEERVLSTTITVA